jgi:O-succinylbenzoate synthase
MAKASVEMALWDLWAKQRRRSLALSLGGRRRRVEVGVSVGIHPTPEALVRRVGAYLDEGYRRVKLKVRPGWDEAPVRAVRRAFPDLRLWVDANQAYPPSAVAEIGRWATRFEVEQVEQPFPAQALGAHARLNRLRRFRVCLDESIVAPGSLDEAIERSALSSLNVKPGRVGGLTISRQLQQRAGRARIPAWVGGMLETGVGRAHAVALASLPHFTLPADLSASRRYYRTEIIDRPFELGPGSTLSVPQGPGIGVEVDERSVARHRVRSRRFRSPTA